MLLRGALLHYEAVPGQRDVDHSKTPIRYSLRERCERLGFRATREAEIAPAGAANLVGNAKPARLVTDLAVLGRDDVYPDRFPQIRKTAAVRRERLDPAGGVVPPSRCATGLGNPREAAQQRGPFGRPIPAPRPIVRYELRRRGRPTGKNTRESYTVRQAD
jgi:hypothetical protein